jgi:hypothetical protein
MLLAAAGCSSTGASSIVGEWQYIDNGHPAAIGDVFFNTDGTCGSTLTDQGQSSCRYTCTYRTSGNDLTIASDDDGGAAPSTTTDSFSISGTTLTLDLPDGGGEAQYSRVSSSGNTTCP